MSKNKRRCFPGTEKEGEKIKRTKESKIEAAEQRMMRKEECEKKKADFIRSASLIIKEMDGMSSDSPSELMDELLHSIFFLGEINDCKPEDIVTDDDMLKKFKGRYPRPFELYSSQLPKRSPMSSVLDMIVRQKGQKNEDEIKKKLKEIINKLKENKATNLISSTICVSQNEAKPNSVRYYGVSMSTPGCNAGQIIVAASCLSTWDSYVAGAVMTYYGTIKHPNFDGTIRLPKQVRCEAFSLSDDEKKKDPCRSCGNLFGLTTSETESWPHGHCAEAESVSNLLKNEEGVREKVQLTSTTCTDESRKKAKGSVLTELKRLLQLEKFDWKNEFYTPQGVSS